MKESTKLIVDLEVYMMVEEAYFYEWLKVESDSTIEKLNLRKRRKYESI